MCKIHFPNKIHSNKYVFLSICGRKTLIGYFRILAILIAVSGVGFAQNADKKTQVEIEAGLQSVEAIALDDRLAQEMNDYNRRFREFRLALRAKSISGETRIAAMDKWQQEHKAWLEDWDKRSDHLDEIWNWGPTGMPKAPEKVYDLATAQGRMAAAIAKIRKDEKGTGKTSDRIAQWMQKNQTKVDQAEAERVVHPAPIDRHLTGTSDEVNMIRARRELQRIRKELLAQGEGYLKAAMRDPQSNYSQYKELLSKAVRILPQTQSTTESNNSKK